jgi:DNA-binding NtrC family response regulator
MNDSNLILLADDEESACEAMATCLREDGYKIVVALNVKAARDALGAHPYAVAIIDLQFKNYRGTPEEQSRAGMLILDRALQIPFLEAIIVTGYPTLATAIRAVAGGAFRYIIKADPGTHDQTFMSQLGEAVRLALDTRTLMIALTEDLLQLRESLQKLNSTLAPSDTLDYATNVLKDAVEVYKRILLARGKHPDPQFLESLKKS